MNQQFEPATDRTIRAYAHRLRQGDRNLTPAAARELAEKHEGERAAAHQRNQGGAT